MKQVTDFISCCGRGVSMILFLCTRIHEIVNENYCLICYVIVNYIHTYKKKKCFNRNYVKLF